MQRSLVLVLVGLSGCALNHAQLRASGQLTMTRNGDGSCGPIGIRRSSLGARWGEYVRVWVSSSAPVSGEARLHVDGRASPLQRFDTAPTGSAVAVSLEGEGLAIELPAVVPVLQQPQHIVLDAAWANERLDVPAAIEAGHVIDVTVSDLRAASGNCADVVFTVEQGVFQPNVDERAWIAELTRRGGPELQAWLAAEEQRKEEIRQQHYAMAEQRRVEWQVQLEARREATRVEEAEQVAAVRAEEQRREEIRQQHYAMAEQRRVEWQVQLEARREAARREEAEQVAAVRAEEVRRASIREAHDAEYDQRRESRLQVESAQQVTVAPVPPAGAVCRPSPVSVGVASARGASSTMTGCEDGSVTVGGGVSTIETGAGSMGGETMVASDGARVEGGAVVGASVTTNTETRVGLESRTVSTEQVAAESASFPGWSTPTTFSRVAVSTESVAPVPPPQPRVVEARVEADLAVAAIHVLGALFRFSAPPPQPVHRAVPATPPNAPSAGRVPAPPPPPAR